MNQPKSGRGGARPGAGRKPGSLNRRTRDIAEKAAATGRTPLEVMLGVMDELHTKALAAKVADDRITLLRAAADVAKNAAPFVHPRLATVELSGAIGTSGRPPLSDAERASRLATLLDRARRNAAAAEVGAGLTEAPSAKVSAPVRADDATARASAAASAGDAR